MPLEVVLDACVACAGPGPNLAPSIIGSGGSPSVGPPPGPRNDNVDLPDPPHDPDPGENRDDSRKRKRNPWDRLFGESGSEVAEDVVSTVAQDIVIGTALDVAGAAAPLADGTRAIVENDGYGLGGSSESGREAMDAALNEIQGTNNPRPKSRRNK